MLAAYSVARVVPPLARVLSPAIAGFTSSAISAASGAPGQPRRRVRPDVRFDVPKASKRWDNRGLDRATAPAGQTTSRRLAEVLRAPPSSPSSVIAKPTPSSVAKPTPMLKIGLAALGPQKETNDTKPKTFREYLNLGDTEWLVIDEADVLLGPDFINETSRVVKRVLAASPNVNVLLVTATLPPSLVRVLEGDLFGGEFTHLLSPGLHRLPQTTRYPLCPMVKRGFAEDALDAKLSGNEGKPRAVVFCSSVGQVKAITTALEEKAVAALAWTGDSPERVRGRDGPLEAFLARGQATDPKGPRVLVTTSLLSRGLDFSADVTTIYLVDPPRDVLDFVHRAGRAGRAGRHGRVVVFGVNGANELKYGKEIKSVLGKVERRQAVKPGGRTWSGKDKERSRK
ncbi:hypothetical protein CcaverHIS002_0702000 [Cutaneotrichosporon cavernicola]|nr:hypothetical protein CcaverHIS002_0702000 [Cutaneotrichosporon cavernicola]